MKKPTPPKKSAGKSPAFGKKAPTKKTKTGGTGQKTNRSAPKKSGMGKKKPGTGNGA